MPAFLLRGRPLSSVIIKHWSEGVKLSSWRSFIVSSVICLYHPLSLIK